MRIHIKLYATLTDYLPAHREGNKISVDVAEGCTVMGALAPYNLPPKLTHLVLVDGTFIPPENRDTHVMHDGETLAVWPPIAGG
jgi:sulfur-carrier protein